MECFVGSGIDIMVDVDIEEYVKRNNKEVITGKPIENTTTVACPHCGVYNQFGQIRAGNRLECYNCKKEFLF